MQTKLPATTFFLLGPTAVGKSELAVAFAERIGGEIVGANAFQIYSGLDVLGAKPSREVRARVPHYLIGEIPLSDPFDVVKYLALAAARIADIAKRGCVPIVCGGNGLYIRALTHGLADIPPGDAALRAKLEKETLPALVARLRTLDPAAQVDEKNPRRVIRALEVCLLSGRPFSASRTEWKAEPEVRGVILTRPRTELHARIAARTEAMFADGVIAEVAAVTDLGPTASEMLGLREIRAHIAGTMTLAECKTAITQSTRQYAKRQLTWFRRERGYTWLDLAETPDPFAALIRAAGCTESSNG